MSRDEIEGRSPSRKDGIDALYDNFYNTLTAFLFKLLDYVSTSKSEEAAHPLNDVLRASSEILHKQNLSFLPYLLPAGWLKKYREYVLGAEYLILTTLNFELNVKHPYATLTTVLSKPGLAQSDMMMLALTLVSEGMQACQCQKFWGLGSSLWLQFHPHHIAAGAVYLACKLLNWDSTDLHYVWDEFQLPSKPSCSLRCCASTPVLTQTARSIYSR